ANPELCKTASALLLEGHAIYIQPINYPTVRKGTERLRITPSPYHTDALIDALAESLLEVWDALRLPLKKRALAAEKPPPPPAVTLARSRPRPARRLPRLAQSAGGRNARNGPRAP